MKQKLVVIGNGMAGMRVVEELLGLAPDAYEITVFGAEPHGNYNRIMLTPVLFGIKSFKDIVLHDFAWYQKNNITLHCGLDKTVIFIDRESRLVVARDGTTAEYDKLLIATGSRPYRPPIPGSEVEGVMGFRDIADVNAMIQKASTRQNAIVLGGGLLGLEAANGLCQRGMSVTVVNRAEHILNKQLDKTAANLLQQQLQQQGLAFNLGASVKRVISKDNHIRAVVLDDVCELPTDLLIIATGITPNMELAQQAGLHCERGIVVDDSLLSDDPNIYAVGECIQHRGELFGLVAPVYEQAKVCAHHLAGSDQLEFRQLAAATMLKVSGIDLFSVGDYQESPDSESLVYIDHARRLYKKIVLQDHRIRGVVMYGDTQGSHVYLNLLKQQRDIADIRDQLMFAWHELAA